MGKKEEGLQVMFDEALQSNTEMQKKEREGTTGRNTERNAEYSPRLREEKYRTVSIL